MRKVFTKWTKNDGFRKCGILRPPVIFLLQTIVFMSIIYSLYSKIADRHYRTIGHRFCHQKQLQRSDSIFWGCKNYLGVYTYGQNVNYTQSI